MFIEERIKLFVTLGEHLSRLSEESLDELARAAGNQNSWFTKESVVDAIAGICSFLNETELREWLSVYDFHAIQPKKVGVVAAGNIPLVGFHDILAVLISGHHLMIKPSTEDSYLVRYMLHQLAEIDHAIKEQFTIVERLNAADAYIATGSDNTARYFKYYFKEKPSIIRSNRSSVAVLTGKESIQELEVFGQDIFQYFGLGCRNVSKILIPNGFDLTRLLDALQGYEQVGNHHKYRNNYDYNKSIYLVNREPHLDTGFLLLRESDELVSPISVLYYQYYQEKEDLTNYLADHDSKIQCVVGTDYIPFGQAQRPTVKDYADGVDTMAFLTEI
ncbi:acyl-CoA reductase [Reichenbachiella agarivorans]|uniref:Acyl-CoA reductase n=1 Tax=Reichenbachiella agarivorans TaxID=2979464 RepID=A0ABY6CKP8_9BACT|nr:acyl-CoA reductase [Reichenbachiella agarivorans]UXP31102.1 acyl-CoA reductase [Reichenbachiella agarivorans]